MSTAFSPPLSPTRQPNFAHFTYNIHAVSEYEDSQSGHLKNHPGNHWLSLVLMKENNSLTRAKTVQKQPFLMSDTSRPPDAFYVSNSLIKQHPGERDRGHMKCVYNFWCLNCQVRFWDSDLHTTRFNHTRCSAIYRFFYSSLTICSFLPEQSGWLFFRQTLNIKRVRSGIPCSEVCYPQKKEGEREF